MPHPYQALITWSPEDDLFIAQVPDLPGCMAHGESEAEALANIRDAILLYIDDVVECGEPLPQPRQYHLVAA